MSTAFHYVDPSTELRRALMGVDCDRVDIEIAGVRDLDAEELARAQRKLRREPEKPGPLHSQWYKEAWWRLKKCAASEEDELALCYSPEDGLAIRRMREHMAKPPNRSRMVDARLDMPHVEYDDRLCFGLDSGRRPMNRAHRSPPRARLSYEVWRER